MGLPTPEELELDDEELLELLELDEELELELDDELLELDVEELLDDGGASTLEPHAEKIRLIQNTNTNRIGTPGFNASKKYLWDDIFLTPRFIPPN